MDALRKVKTKVESYELLILIGALWVLSKSDLPPTVLKIGVVVILALLIAQVGYSIKKDRQRQRSLGGTALNAQRVTIASAVVLIVTSILVLPNVIFFTALAGLLGSMVVYSVILMRSSQALLNEVEASTTDEPG